MRCTLLAWQTDSRADLDGAVMVVPAPATPAELSAADQTPRLLVSAPADRNKQPILDLLRQLLPERGNALEIASGTGQHVAWFGAGLPQWTWQPTDADPGALDSIATWVA